LAENVGGAYTQRGTYVQYAMVRYVSFNTAIKFACFEHKYHIKKNTWKMLGVVLGKTVPEIRCP